MRENYFRYILRFIVLVLVQVLFLSNMSFLGFATPYLYILFILTFPIRFPRPLFLILAFALGLTIDMFMNTLGLHIFATVLIAFVRPYILNLLISKGDAYQYPNLETLKIEGFAKYTVAMVFIHHTVLFTLEAFSFRQFWMVLLSILLNGIITSVLIYIIQLYSHINKRKRR